MGWEQEIANLAAEWGTIIASVLGMIITTIQAIKRIKNECGTEVKNLRQVNSNLVEQNKLTKEELAKVTLALEEQNKKIDLITRKVYTDYKKEVR